MTGIENTLGDMSITPKSLNKRRATAPANSEEDSDGDSDDRMLAI